MIKLYDVIVESTIFPDKTSQVWKVLPALVATLTDKTETVEYTWDFENEAEFVHLAQLKMLVDSLAPNARSFLKLPYLPYARQDKAVDNESTFALFTFKQLIENLGFDHIQAIDVHSFEAVKIRGMVNMPPKEQINSAIKIGEANVICFPDQGAKDRYEVLLKNKMQTEFATKVRDQSSGAIKSLVLENTGDLQFKRVLIIDDICDGGGTFVALAKLLYAKEVAEVQLYVTHGLFTKGIQVLKDAGIKRIFTAKGEVK